MLLSGRGQHDHDLAERAVQKSGAEWTVVRSAWFAQIERATGRPVRYLPASEQDFTTEMRRAGEPDELVAVLTEVLAELRDGRNASLGDGVQRALGRSPRDFAAFARAAAADGAWTPHALTHSYLCCGSTGADPVIQLRAYGRVRISQPAR